MGLARPGPRRLCFVLLATASLGTTTRDDGDVTPTEGYELDDSHCGTAHSGRRSRTGGPVTVTAAAGPLGPAARPPARPAAAQARRRSTGVCKTGRLPTGGCPGPVGETVSLVTMSCAAGPAGPAGLGKLWRKPPWPSRALRLRRTGGDSGVTRLDSVRSLAAARAAADSQIGSAV